MTGQDFRALVRLSDREDRTIAGVGETCERMPDNSRWDLFLGLGWIEPISAEVRAEVLNPSAEPGEPAEPDAPIEPASPDVPDPVEEL